MTIDALVRLHRWWRWLLAGGSSGFNMRGLKGFAHLVQGTLMLCIVLLLHVSPLVPGQLPGRWKGVAKKTHVNECKPGKVIGPIVPLGFEAAKNHAIHGR